MDPVTAVGLAASIVQLIDSTAKTLRWINEVKDAPKERATLALEMASLLGLLTSLRYRVEDCRPNGSWFGAVRFLAVKNGPLDQLSSTMEELHANLSSSSGLKRLKDTLLWPYTKKDIQNLLSRVERCKSTINLAFQKDLSHLVLAIKSDTAVLENMNDEMKSLAENIEKMRLLRKSDKHKAAQKRLAKDRQEIIEWISPLNFFPVQEDILKKRQEGTCGGFLTSHSFTEWVSSAGSILWCPGIPGAGKTVFTSIAVDHLRREYAEDRGVATAVVYCNYKEEFQQTVVNLLAGIWRQLVQSGGSPSSDISLIYKTHKERGTALTLWEISEELRSEIRRFQKCFIIVDALDECSESNKTRSTLVRVLYQLLPNANLMFTSRPYDSIKAELKPHLNLEIGAHQDDVAKYVRGRIATENRLRRHIEKDPTLGEEIVRKVSTNAEKMFLLVQLQMDSLAHQGTRRALENALARLPQELDTIYDDALLRIAAQHEYDRDLAFQVISFISFAYRPLKRQELQHALAIELGEQEFDDRNIPDEELLTSVCAGLIVIDAVNDVFLPIHYTTQEYFERIRNLKFPAAQRKITEVCLTYLSYDCFATRGDSFSYHFLDYAAVYWSDHFAANVPLDESVKTLLWGFLQKEGNVSFAIAASCSKFPRRANHLQVAVSLGILEFVQKFIKQKVDMNYRNGTGSTALHLAVAQANDQMVSAILAGSPDVNIQDKDGLTALHIAANKGNRHLATCLLQNGALLELKDNWGCKVLHHASQGGDRALVSTLLENYSPNVNETDNGNRTPLHYATIFGHAEIVDLLIQSGADHNIREADDRLDSNFKKRQGRTALHLAARSGDAAIIGLLLQRIPDTELKDGDGNTALYIAVMSKNLATTRALIEKGAGHAPGILHVAAANCDPQMMQLLLQGYGDIDVNARDAEGNSPLCISAREANAPGLSLLLRMRSDIDINQANNYGKSPLHLATEASFSSGVRILIEARADIEHPNNYGETALHRAAENGYVDVLQELLAAGANIHALDVDGESPLHRAVAKEELKALSVLLADDRLDVNLQDYKGNTPLHRAAKVGNVKVVKSLVANKSMVRLDLLDSDGLTALDWATLYEYRDVIDELTQLVEQGW